MNTLDVRYVNLLQLIRWPRNPRAGHHDLQAIRDSIVAYGFNDPIVVDTLTGFIVEGHGRLATLEAMKAQGGSPPTHVETTASGWLVPVIFRAIPDMASYALVHNRLTELGGWNETRLREVLAEQARRGDRLLEATGFDGEDLDWLIRRAIPVAANVVQAIEEKVQAQLHTLLFRPTSIIFEHYYTICERLGIEEPEARLSQMLDIACRT